MRAERGAGQQAESKYKKRQIAGNDPEPSVFTVRGQDRRATRNYGRGLEVSVQDQLRGIGIWTFSDV